MPLTAFEQLLLAIRGGSALASGAGGVAGAEANPLGAVSGAARAGQGINDLSELAGYGNVIPGLEYLSGPLGVASGAANRNPFSILNGLGSMARSASGLFPVAADVGVAGLEAGAGAVGGFGGAAGAGVATGLEAGAAGVGGFSGALGAGAATGLEAGAAASGGLAGASAAGGGALAGGLGVAAGVAGTVAPLLTVGAIAYMNHQKKEAERIRKQTLESGQIRRGAAENMPRLVHAAAVANAIDNIAGLPPEQQKAALERAIGELDTGLIAGTQVQHLINTKGQGGRATLTKPADTTEAERYYTALLPDVQVGRLRASDAAARVGVDPHEVVGRNDPAAMWNQMYGTPGWDPYWDASIDWTKQAPGNLGAMATDLAKSGRADLRNTGQWGDLLNDIPALTLGQDVSPDTIAAAGGKRQQDAIQERAASQARGEGPDALAYIAPYLPGGNEALWREYGLDPAQRFAAGGYSTIGEGLARKQQLREHAVWGGSQG